MISLRLIARRSYCALLKATASISQGFTLSALSIGKEHLGKVEGRLGEGHIAKRHLANEDPAKGDLIWGDLGKEYLSKVEEHLTKERP
jgi:hypothetical protein